MFIAVQALQEKEISFKEKLSPGTLDLGPDISQLGPLVTQGRASLVEEHEGKIRIADIRLVGEFRTRLELKCARCLEPVERDVAGQFDLIYRPLGAVQSPAEKAISEAETEMGFYQGGGLQLEDALKEQVLLAVPMREICQADCKGLCPQCGRNLNTESCDCPPRTMDPRWAALESIKEKLQ
ncbi:MAG TPA: DUF177 domain-containing protein [Terriglobales bacterium]|nr:DUF177 domain-containing protein [Terriglobales bacterium]